MRLAGKTALITGGASGFGAAIAACFIAEGARVAIMDINAAATQDMAGKLGNDCIGIVGDVTKSSDIQRATQTARDFGDALDIVVNNAGWTHVNKPMLDVTEDEFDRLYDINVKSIFHMTNAVVPIMRTQGHGTIINIGSTAGLRPRPGLTWYNSTKGAVNLLSKSMAVASVTFVGYAGIVLGPAIIGFGAQYTSLPLAMASLALFGAVYLISPVHKGTS